MRVIDSAACRQRPYLVSLAYRRSAFGRHAQVGGRCCLCAFPRVNAHRSCITPLRRMRENSAADVMQMRPSTARAPRMESQTERWQAKGYGVWQQCLRGIAVDLTVPPRRECHALLQKVRTVPSCLEPVALCIACLCESITMCGVFVCRGCAFPGGQS